MKTNIRPGFVISILSFLSLLPWRGAQAQSPSIPTLAEAQAAKRDVWGEAAMQQPNGPSYEFFEKLLPPPRYVDAEFHYYPLLLSAPNAPVKAHLVSNGSGVNLRGI